MTTIRSVAWAVVMLTVANAVVRADVSDVPSNPGVMTDVERAAAHVRAEEFPQALRLLEPLATTAPDDPEVWSMLGFASRKTGRMERAEAAYERALTLDPLHLGANEYAGEMWLERGDLTRARERLSALSRACPSGCEERAELEAAIAARSAR